VLPRVPAVTTSADDRDVADFYAATCGRLVRVLRAAGGSHADAEEIAQDAYVRLLPRWDAVRRYEDPEGWVRSVAMRLLISRARRARVARLGADRMRAQTPPRVDGLDADGVAVERALAALPVPQRAVVVLHHLLDLPVEQVAHELRIPVGTVKSRLSRARLALRPLLADHEESHHA
jgi:RNA polymerase sigma-70 factor (ECF subfamily)